MVEDSPTSVVGMRGPLDKGHGLLRKGSSAAPAFQPSCPDWFRDNSPRFRNLAEGLSAVGLSGEKVAVNGGNSGYAFSRKTRSPAAMKGR